MFIQDLDPHPASQKAYQTLSIGWLCKIPPKRPLPQGFLNKLHEYLIVRIRPQRGLFPCPFCWFNKHPVVNVLGKSEKCGFGETWVITGSTLYVAPYSLYHYVEKHKYCPPEVFVEAVMSCPSPNDQDYYKRLSMLEVPYWRYTREGIDKV